jgi:hypothetical protein
LLAESYLSKSLAQRPLHSTQDPHIHGSDNFAHLWPTAHKDCLVRAILRISLHYPETSNDVDQTHRLSERNFASESDWKSNNNETPKPEHSVISGRIQKALLSERNVGRRPKRKRMTKNAGNLIPQLQQPTLQGERYRCYVPGCRRARGEEELSINPL